MAGTRIGGLKARNKNLARDPNWYATIGAKGGRAGTTGGFQYGSALAREAGRKGGTISRRKSKITTDVSGKVYVRLTPDDQLAKDLAELLSTELNGTDF